MTDLPKSLKIYYKDLSYKLNPTPTSFFDLLQSSSKLIPCYPKDPVFSYTDQFGDSIKIYNSKSYSTFLSDLIENSNFSLDLHPSCDEIFKTTKLTPTLKSSEEDIINLTLLGIVYLNKEVLQLVQYIQTEFSKKVVQEILNLVKESSMEQVAERFYVSWEVIFFMTQRNNMNKNSPFKRINYTKVKNIVRPSQVCEAVKDYVAGTIKKKEIMNKFEISSLVFENWVKIFKDPQSKPARPSHLQNKEKMKLVSSYLTGKVDLDDLKYDYNISESEIVSWALLFSHEEKVYERERIISAEEKYDVLDRYFKGNYTVEQFQNDYGISENLFYRWVRQVQSGKPLTSSNIFRTASDELEQAYDIFLESIAKPK